MDRVRNALLLRRVFTSDKRLRLVKEKGGAEHVLKEFEKSPQLFMKEGDGVGSDGILRRSELLSSIEREIEDAAKAGIEIIPFGDPLYPHLLAQISNPPDVLYIRGDTSALSSTQSLAVVGTRKATHYGKKVIRSLIPELVRSGFIIVSGLAEGIDTEAHTATLDAGGITVAVLGTQVDRIYPASNSRLAKIIMEKGGALISELSPGTPPYPSNFPKRNRMISGLSMGVLVVEAGEKSGALITARYGLEQGREVYAVPGSIFSPMSYGCNKLIKEGAKPVTSPDDILEDILPIFTRNRKRKEKPTGDLSIHMRMSDEERLIFSILCEEPMSIDEISSSSKMSIKEVSRILTTLEVQGLAEHLTGRGFVRK